ncbi:hypothetical protein [Nocardia brasiliensis]|uniref:hypothetical protein n=1 Tax=Nocardia brasiliensis TaxID=37326 RepID=UPI003D8CC4B7
MVIVYLSPIEYCTVANLVGTPAEPPSLPLDDADGNRRTAEARAFATRVPGASRTSPEPDATNAALRRPSERAVRALETRTIATRVPAARSSPETHSPFDLMRRSEIGVLALPSIDP